MPPRRSYAQWTRHLQWLTMENEPLCPTRWNVSSLMLEQKLTFVPCRSLSVDFDRHHERGLGCKEQRKHRDLRNDFGMLTCSLLECIFAKKCDQKCRYESLAKTKKFNTIINLEYLIRKLTCLPSKLESLIYLLLVVHISA